MLAALILAACSVAESSYFDLGESADSVSLPVPSGQTAYVGVGDVSVMPPDEVRFVRGEAVGPGQLDEVRFLIVPLRETTGGIGAITEADLGPNELDPYRPLEGAVFTSGAGSLAVVLVVAVERDIVFEYVRIYFSVNGGPEQVQRLRTAGRLCAGDVMRDCPAPDPPRP